MRPELARRQREKAEALAAGDPRLDLSVESLVVLIDRERTDEVLAYVGEVLLRWIGAGEWDRTDDGAPAITVEGRTFDLRPMTVAEATRVMEYVRDPTDEAARRLWPPERRHVGAAPVVLLYLVAMVALIWWFAGPRAALVGAAFGLGFHLVQRWRQPRAR